MKFLYFFIILLFIGIVCAILFDHAFGMLISLFLLIPALLISNAMPNRNKQRIQYREQLDGNFRTYQCQNTGMIVDLSNKTIKLFSAENSKTYSVDDVKAIEFSHLDSDDQDHHHSHRYIVVQVKDEAMPLWKIEYPLIKNSAESAELIRTINDNWSRIFKKYIL